MNYTQGALRYVFQTPNSQLGQGPATRTQGFGVLSDAVYGGATFPARLRQPALQLTTAWNVNAAYEHFWNPRWRTSLYGGYAVSRQQRRNSDPLFNGSCRLYRISTGG